MGLRSTSHPPPTVRLRPNMPPSRPAATRPQDQNRQGAIRSRHRASAQGPVQALPQEHTLVPVLVLQQGLPVRQMPRRSRKAQIGACQPDDLRTVLARTELPSGGLQVLRECIPREEAVALLGGRQRDEGQKVCRLTRRGSIVSIVQVG